MNVISSVLKNTEIVGEETYKNLTLHYLRTEKQPQDMNVLSFEEADAVAVEEVDEGGTVSKLKVTNNGMNPVFFIEGTIIEGMKQNRFIRNTFILNAKQEYVLDVCCTEAGRWAQNTVKGQKSDYMVFTSIRSASSSAIRKVLKRMQDKGNIQNEVWQKINEKMWKSQAESKTSFVGDYYKKESGRLEEYKTAFRCPDTANGLLAMINGVPVEMTMMGNPRFLQQYFKKLTTGIVSEAIDEDFCEALKSKKAMTVNQFFNFVSRSKKDEYQPETGNGVDFRFGNKAYTGSALIADNNLIHMGVYAI